MNGWKIIYQVYQTVKFSDQESSEISGKNGVPRGPFLFINDLPEMLKNCKIHMFTDDIYQA